MSRQIVIYRPYGSGCTDAQEAVILRKFPGCRFVSQWEPNAIMWQDAAK